MSQSVKTYFIGGLRYDYWKLCKLARDGQIDLNARSGDDKPGFVKVKSDGAVAQVVTEEPMRVCEIRIRFSNGLVLSRCGGDVEISNNISEQSVRKLKVSLRNAGNIGSESSAADNAFMYSMIGSCNLYDIDPGKYISYLLGKLKTAREGEDLAGLLPCYCGL